MRASIVFFFSVLMCCLLVQNGEVAAHPHAFVEASVTIVFDENGLAGFKQRWVIDEMTSFTVLDMIRENNDGTLDAEEVDRIRQESFQSIKQFDFFTAILNQGTPFIVEYTQDFTASLDGAKLVYNFFVPCHVTATKAAKEVKIALYDKSFYTFVAYKKANGETIDPSKDPLFGNPMAGATPEDFKRFTDSVGVTEYKGKVNMEGTLDGFSVEAVVVDAPEMSYFYDQIIPQAFRVRFKKL